MFSSVQGPTPEAICRDSKTPTYLSTRVLITANVSSTRPSTFCFFRRGSCGPRPRLGGRTGSRGRLPRASGASTAVWSPRLSCLRGADPSSTSLSSLQTQLFPMVPEAPRVCQNCSVCSCSTVSRRTRARLLLAQNAIQVATIISFGGSEEASAVDPARATSHGAIGGGDRPNRRAQYQ